MRAFDYERPTTLQGAVALLAEHGSEARLLAGGTSLIIRLRDGSIAPRLAVDLKRIAELDGQIREHDGGLTIGARAVMTDIAADGRIRRDYRALAEAAAVVGSVQIRNRATLAGNICNASPAADPGARAPRLRRPRQRGGSGRPPTHPDRRVLRPVGCHDPCPRRARHRDRAAAPDEPAGIRPPPTNATSAPQPPTRP